MNHSENKVKSEMHTKRLPMVRKGFASGGRNISLLTNHFKSSSLETEGHFYLYDLSVKYEDDSPVDGKGIGRRILDIVYEIYSSKLNRETFAYDDEKRLFTVGPLPQNKMEFTVTLDEVTSNRNVGSEADDGLNESDRKRPRTHTYSKTYKVAINYAAKIPLQAIEKLQAKRASLVEKSRQMPAETMNDLKQALIGNKYGAKEFAQIQGRVLAPPTFLAGEEKTISPHNGRWNFDDKKLFKPITLERWAVANFSGSAMEKFCTDLVRCGESKGMRITPAHEIFDENSQFKDSPAQVRVEKMIDMMKSRLLGKPQFLFCILKEKNSDLYGVWKKKNHCEEGIVTQCFAPTTLISPEYLTNLLLKINVKLGGLNSSLSIPLMSRVPTLIVGMGVSHGSPGLPPIAAVVSSREWPSTSRYRAGVRTQSPKLEMIDSLFKKVSDTEDQGLFRVTLDDFCASSNQRKPEHIIIFRDDVSESQFIQVLNVELEQIIQACKFLDESWSPKFMVVVVETNHHTKIFQMNPQDNVPTGTVIDDGICHPRTNDFYMCIGTATQPTHYHVLLDEIGFSPDDMQEFVHTLSYAHQNSTNATAVVTPIYYARLAASRMSKIIKFDEVSEGLSGDGETTSEAGEVSVPQFPLLHDNIRNTMFFC